MIISVVDVDNRQSSDFKLHRENGSADYLFVLFKSPAMVMEKGTYIPVDKGNCILFDKQQLQSYFPCHPHDFLHDYMHFDLESDYEKALFADIPKGTVLTLVLPDPISDTLSELKNELKLRFSTYKKEILDHLGSIFLFRLKHEINLSEIHYNKGSHLKLLYQLRMEIYHHPQRDWSIDNICKMTCMSRSYFQHLYKTFFDISCTADVIHARIESAKALLINSNFSVNEIAEKCGYQSTSFFIRQFKKEIGVSPERFRSG